MMISVFLLVFVCVASQTLAQSQPFGQCGGQERMDWANHMYYGQTVSTTTTSATTTVKTTTSTTVKTTSTTATTSTTSATVTGFPASAPTTPPSNLVGITPALGWNSWNAYACSISEAKILAAANQFVSLGLKAAGYQYINIDDCWSVMARNSTNNQIIPDPTKFPNGIASIASQVHALGLVGVDPPQNNDWYNSNSAIRYRQMTAALAAQPRPIQFNLCLWGNYDVWDWGSRVGHSWRLSGGHSSASWSYITSIISTSVAHPGTFSGHGDMDMMEIGNGPLTIQEQRTHFAAWIMLKSPILLGTDLSLLNSTQLAIIKNAELLAFHQDLTVGGPAVPFTPFASAPTTSPPEYYVGKSSKGTHIFIINTSATAATKSFVFSNAGLGSGTFSVHDMWAGTDLPGTFVASAIFSVTVQPHDTVAYFINVFPAFTRALACLSRYGEDLAIYATSESISLSTTNSSKSAYCRFKYGRQFFSKYNVSTPDAWTDGDEDGPTVTGQLLTKSLLSILRHRTVEKSVERCELSIADGAQQANRSDAEQDGLESKLIVRLHCKHGVIKTHRLLLLTLTSFLAPGVPDASNESHLTVGPRALRDMIEHFPVPKGARSDPQLIWNFGESEVEVKSFESSLDSKGRNELSTELTISADEFDLYDVFATPTTIAFHLREFNATIAFAESMSLALELRFTDPAAPLFIDVEGDNADTLFVISTSQVPGAPMASQASTVNPKKREREETPRDFARIKKSMKAVQRTDAASVSLAHADRASRSQSTATSRTAGSMPPPPVLQRSYQSHHEETFDAQMTPGPSRHEEPLFLPMSSQMSAADEQILRETGLGIEEMNADELEMMLEGDGEEVEFTGSQMPTKPDVNMVDMDDAGDDMEFGATQSSDRGFQPLFED
ncbi:hypothetical protein MVEN_00538300 [Mycena venus]|uniref:Alpha-galactosidase n=1 Tax=Mycena venus TaxID=2733690 RepID=A0A8H7D7R2_9AGAR|nr:hypothetical protein MVEN_00538300 [Mycena venus]